MKIINIALLAVLIGVWSLSYAEGDKVRDGNVVFDDDGEPVGIVVPVDCTKTFSPQSGAAVYFCVVEEAD